MSALPDLEDILLEQRQSTLIVTLNRPAVKNAINGAIMNGLSSLCDWLADRRDIRAVVFRGAGGVFCGGGDIKEFGQMLMAPMPEKGAADPVVAGNRAFGDVLLKLDALEQVLISVVDGAAVGGAMGFVSVSDIVIAEEGARFTLTETTLGIPPAQIGPFLVRRLGLYAARRLALTGSQIDAAEALRIGLVTHRATGVSGLEAALVEVLSAVGRCEPEANAVTKHILNSAAQNIDLSDLDAAAEAFARCLRGRGKQGAMAFAQKQTPPWVETYSMAKEA